MSSPALFVELSHDDGQAVVRLIGELDIAGVDHATIQAIRALAAQPGGPLVIDLSELTFCDSSGLHVLYEIEREAERRGREVILRRPREIVRRVLEVADMEALFVIDDTDPDPRDRPQRIEPQT